MRREATSRVFDDLDAFHKPGATQVVKAWESGFVAEMDTTALGWAVQRTGAGREKAGEPVDPHAGIVFHARRGAEVKRGEPFATIYATRQEMLAEPAELIRKAVVIAKKLPEHGEDDRQGLYAAECGSVSRVAGERRSEKTAVAGADCTLMGDRVK